MLQIAKHQFHDVYQFHTGKFKIFTWNSKKKEFTGPKMCPFFPVIWGNKV